MIKVLHFSDAHIDIANHGRHDPQTGIPVRVLDFLKALDAIVDSAITEQVDLVLFAGDAYKDRTPVPTFQREWGRRIQRLSLAGIRTLLVVGNHDISPAVGRAHTMQEFETLNIPHIFVASKPMMFSPADLEGLPVQILALPWVSRSGLLATLEMNGEPTEDITMVLEERLTRLIQMWLARLDPNLPTIFTAHTSVQGATYGNERQVMLGKDLVLPFSLVGDPRLDYVALGHIHKAQNLNEHAHPPVIYPGSIERVDFGEAGDDKFFVIAEVEKGKTQVEWRELNGRRFIDLFFSLNTAEEFSTKLRQNFPSADQLADAVVRLVVEYRRELEPYLDEPDLRRRAENALEFHLLRKPQVESRLRLPQEHRFSEISPVEMVEIYFESIKQPAHDVAELIKLAGEIMAASQSLQDDEHTR